MSFDFKRKIMNALKCLILMWLSAITGFAQIKKIQENQYDPKGERHGVWRGYYEDSHLLRYEGKFDHGKEIGLFTYYTNSDKKIVMATRNFDGKGNAYTTFFDEKGNKVSEGNAKNQMRQGIWKFYHKGATSVMSTENYVNDEIEGIRKVFYSDGKLAEEIPYKNGLKNGIGKKYSNEGKLVEEATYINGQMQGSYTVYNANKVVVIKGQFKADKKNAIWSYYDDSGKLIRQINADTINGFEKPTLIKKK